MGRAWADCWQLVRAQISSESCPWARFSLLGAAIVKRKMFSWIKKIKKMSLSPMAALVAWYIKIICSVAIGCISGLLFKLENVLILGTFAFCQTPSGHARWSWWPAIQLGCSRRPPANHCAALLHVRHHIEWHASYRCLHSGNSLCGCTWEAAFPPPCPCTARMAPSGC